MRVVSLVPSATESLLDWGVTPVACTRFCEQPDLRHVGGTKDPDVAAIVDLAPDLVVMCEEENLRAHHDELVAAGLRCHTVRISSVADVPAEMAALADAAGLDPAASAVELPEGVHRAAGGAHGAVRPRAFVPIWRRPWMSLNRDTYGSSLLEHLGIDNVCADDDVRYPEVGLDEIRRRRPDVVLAPTEPYPFGERHLAELREIAPAVLVDGQDLFWWGTRTPAAIGRLASALATVTG
ncbi:MAG: helical backbone metal receptor [Actinomycetota bacterium]|nr:helical backbone metal receptor [Actinomycetota bacterium]